MKRTAAIVYLVVSLSGIFAGAFLTGCDTSVKQSNQTQTKAVDETDDESLYQASGTWDNQYGDTLLLSKLTGKIPVIAMIFTRCTFACPRIVADLKAIEKQVPDNKKDQVVFVLVSFDADRDHTPQLKAFAKKKELDDNWLVLHGNDEDVRQLSMLLEVKYKKQPNGDFTHSNGITLLDTHGAIAAQIEGLGADARQMIEKIKAL